MRARTRTTKAARGSSQWETVASGGFPPIWQPHKEGEAIVVSLLELRIPSGKVRQPLVTCRLISAENTNSFMRGKGKQKSAVAVRPGEMVSIPLSANLEQAGIGTAGTGKNAKPQWGKLGAAAVEKKAPLRFEFRGEIPLGGKQTVRTFIIQAPVGLLG